VRGGGGFACCIFGGRRCRGDGAIYRVPKIRDAVFHLRKTPEINNSFNRVTSYAFRPH
jgi:hypothetical protein